MIAQPLAPSPHRVVLLGGGYVTLHAYAGLMRHAGREVRSGEVEIVVISTDDAHSFHGFTGEVLAGMLPYERTRTPLASAMPHAHVVLGRALAVDARSKLVTYASLDAPGQTATSATTTEHALAYDDLVVGTGGREPAATVPGLAEHGFTLRAPGDIALLHEHVTAAIESENSSPARVLVAGGGIAGVEMAAAIADLGGDRVTVEIVHSGDALLPDLRAEQPGLARRAERELDRLGVRVRLGVRLASVTSDGAVLDDGTYVRASTVIGTIGQRPVQVPGLGHHRDLRGRLVTRPDLSVIDGVWAAGDGACVAHVRTGEPVPANALWAIKAGAHLGVNIARSLRGRRTREFRYRGLGQAASFGLGRSVADLYGVPLTGWVAWVMRLAFFLRFMPSRRTAAQVAGDLTRLGWGRATGRNGHPARSGAGARLDVLSLDPAELAELAAS